MGYRSEVSIIVGKKINAEIEAYVAKCEAEVTLGKYDKDALENLKWFLSGKTVSADGKYVRYYNDGIKWYTDISEDAYAGLTWLEHLVKKYADMYDNVTEDIAASFIRIGESDDDREDVNNWGSDLQSLGICTGQPYIPAEYTKVSAEARLKELEKEIEIRTCELNELRGLVEIMNATV